MKKILALVLVCVLALSMFACGGTTDGEQNGDANNDTTATLKIGGIGPTTGGAG